MLSYFRVKVFKSLIQETNFELKNINDLKTKTNLAKEALKQKECVLEIPKDKRFKKPPKHFENFR